MTLALLGWIALAATAAAQTAPQTTPRQATPAPTTANPLGTAGAAGPAAEIKALHLGQWLTEGAKSRVEVTDCGQEVCAKIVWLKEPNDQAGKPLRDGYNKNTQLRTRPIQGLALFENMRPAKAGWQGRVYNPEEGEWYDVTVWLAGVDQINIKGCVLFICETHSWNRAPAPLPAPAVVPAAPPAAAAVTTGRRTP